MPSLPKNKPSKNVCLENMRTTVQHIMMSRTALTVFTCNDVYGWEERQLEDMVRHIWKITMKSMLHAEHKAYLYDYHRHITSKAMIAEERFNFTNLPFITFGVNFVGNSSHATRNETGSTITRTRSHWINNLQQKPGIISSIRDVSRQQTWITFCNNLSRSPSLPPLDTHPLAHAPTVNVHNPV